MPKIPQYDVQEINGERVPVYLGEIEVSEEAFVHWLWLSKVALSPLKEKFDA